MDAALKEARRALGPEAFAFLKRASRDARRRERTPSDWLDDAFGLVEADDGALVLDVATSLPDVALREGISDALEDRGSPLDPGLWIDEF